MDLTDPVNNTVQSLDAVSNVAPTNEADRISLKSALFAAISRLETPWETAYRYFFSGVRSFLNLATLHYTARSDSER